MDHPFNALASPAPRPSPRQPSSRHNLRCCSQYNFHNYRIKLQCGDPLLTSRPVSLSASSVA